MLFFFSYLSLYLFVFYSIIFTLYLVILLFYIQDGDDVRFDSIREKLDFDSKDKGYDSLRTLITLTRTCSSILMKVTGYLPLSPKRLLDKPSVHRKYYFKRIRQYLFWILLYYYDEFKSYDWKNDIKQSIINVVFQ